MMETCGQDRRLNGGVRGIGHVVGGDSSALVGMTKSVFGGAKRIVGEPRQGNPLPPTVVSCGQRFAFVPGLT